MVHDNQCLLSKLRSIISHCLYNVYKKFTRKMKKLYINVHYFLHIFFILFYIKKFNLQLCSNDQKIWERVMLQSWLMFAFGVTCEVLQVGLCISKVLWYGLLVVKFICQLNRSEIRSFNQCLYL